jgi:hypothetical protein
MAINPNTDFSPGAVFTAGQADRFPRGVMSLAKATTGQSPTTTEVIAITLPAFTAEAGRNYKISYYEPALNPAGGAGGSVDMKIRLTNVSGTILQQGTFQQSGATGVANATYIANVVTLSAGSTVLVATLVASSGTANAFRSANQVAILTVEDIGTA